MRNDDEPIGFEELARLQRLDEQIDQHLQGNAQTLPDGENALDPPFLRDLRDLHQLRGQTFQRGLDRVWGRLEQHGIAPAEARQPRITSSTQPGVPQKKVLPLPPLFRSGQRWTSWASALVAAVLLVVLISALTLGLILVRHPGNGTPGSPQTTPVPTVIATTPPSPAAFTVTSVDLAMTPASIAGAACGSSISLTYTATFHLAPGGPGGTIQFAYTVNNGRSSTSASVTVSPGQTTRTYTFSSSGTLAADRTYPGVAEVMVTSPNAVQSAQIQPSGSCQ